MFELRVCIMYIVRNRFKLEMSKRLKCHYMQLQKRGIALVVGTLKRAIER